jgi:hypothetical protein
MPFAELDLRSAVVLTGSSGDAFVQQTGRIAWTDDPSAAMESGQSLQEGT